MSRLFDDALTEYLGYGGAVAGLPLAMACFFNTDDLTIEQVLISISDASVQADYHRLVLSGSLGGDPIRAQSCVAPLCVVATTTSGYSANTWHHACALFVSATDRRVFIDGGSKGTDINSKSPSNLDVTTIGYVRASAGHHPFSGMIAEAAIWDLSAWPGATDSDKADNFEKILPSLAKVYTPEHYPLGRVAYWNLVRELKDSVGGYNLTANGTVVATHPRIIQPHIPL